MTTRSHRATGLPKTQPLKMILFFAILGATPVSSSRAEESLAIRNVTLVDVERGGLETGRTVLIEEGKIVAITDAEETHLAEDVNVVEGEGHFLIPGLFDSHVHYVDPATYGPLMIAHGVTFVRDLGGSTEQILAQRDRLNRGEELGPEMIATGAIVDGDPPIWPFSEACDTPEEGRAAVGRLVESGVDQIKVYSMLKGDVYHAIVEETRKLGRVPVGHVPGTVGLLEAAQAGQRSVEHLIGWEPILQRLAGKPPFGARDLGATFRAWEEFPRVNRDELRSEIRRIAETKIFHCPTLVVMHGLGTNADENAPPDPRLDFVPEGLRGFWNSGRYGFGATIQKIFPHMKKMVRELHDGGVPLLVGTDLANPQVFAGSSVHDEMVFFEEAGIPPKDVLRAATVVPSRFFGVADRLGTIAPGKSASLVMLRKNPLARIENVREIEAVFLRGQYFPRPKIEALLREVKERVQGSIQGDGTESEDDLAVPGEIVHRGVYRSTFNGMDSGSETFVLAKTSEGYHLKAHIAPIGFGQPSLTELRSDSEKNIAEHRWTQLIQEPIAVEYSCSKGKASARATQNGNELSRQTLDAGPEVEISGPATAAQFFSKVTENLAVGETKTYSSIGYGYPGWQMAPADVVLTRKPNSLLEIAGRKVETSHYHSTMGTPVGELESETWVAGDGLVLKMVMKLPFGTIETVLDSTP